MHGIIWRGEKMTPDEAYDTCMKIAAEYGLIVETYGGIATIATHDNQREAGIFEKCQFMSMPDIKKEK